MPSGSDGRPRNLLQRDRRAPRCSAARSGRSSPQGSRIRDRQRVSALVSTPRRLSRLLPSYPGHGRTTLIHSCGRFPHEDLAGRPTGCSGAGTAQLSGQPPPEYGEQRRGNSRTVATAMQVPIWARRFMMTSGDGAMAWASNRLWARCMAGRIVDDADIGCRFPISDAHYHRWMRSAI